jgi:hypothetical protein
MGLFKDCGCGCNGKKQEQKFVISLMSALVFFIVANPDTFRLMRAILGSWVSGPNGCPTTAGLILHTIVFMLITWAMMNIKREYYAPYEPAEPARVAAGPAPTMPTGPAPPPAMVDMPAPQPDMTEKSFSLMDTGAVFGSMDLNDVDMPTAMVKKDAVTCACTDGRKVVITP